MKEITLSEIYKLIEQNELDKKLSTDLMKTHRHDAYNPYPHGFNRFDFYKEVFADNYKDGFIMDYPHGRIIRQAQRKFYYRGENEIFPSSQSSLTRHLNGINDNRFINEFLSCLKYLEFTRLLNSFVHTKRFEEIGITVLYEQIAQHYGIKTRWLDITNDFDIALFFACCKFENNKWLPLTGLDFNRKKEAGYGVLFRKSADHISNFLPTEKNKYETLPVGFQPFMRCSMQTAYSIFMDDEMDLQKSDFEMIKFKHSEELSDFIFERLNCGKKVYPHEGLDSLIDQVDLISNSKEFSKEVFDNACECFPELSKDDWAKAIYKNDYTIGNTPINLSNDSINIINGLYKDFQIEEFYNINLSYRLTYQEGNKSTEELDKK